MTYLFPDDDALRLALTAGVVPADWAMTPARAGHDADGRPWITPSSDVPRGVATALRRLGVQSLKTEPPGGANVPHWLAALPLTRDPAPPPLTDQTPVLFELADPADLAPLVGEMLRLGNDRQGVRFLAGESTLLRVVGPPYYSLLRATDRLGERAPRAYVERAPHVWVQVGWTHPLASLLKAPPGQMVLLRDTDVRAGSVSDGHAGASLTLPAPTAASLDNAGRGVTGDWLTLDDIPWRDIYDVLEFAVPGAPTAWADAPPAGKLAVPMRFAVGAPNESPELWVIDGGDEDKVDALVRDADERLLSRLAFAAGEHDGQRVLVLRARPSKTGPPVLVLDALACRPYLRLPNLFVPIGKRLRPPLRRDAVRKLLAPDPDVVTWLAPRDGDTFAAQSLPESAFRPLDQWVEYVLDRDRDALDAWLRSATFDFGQYVGKEELVAVRGKPPKPREKPKPAAADEAEVRPPVPPRVVRRPAPAQPLAPLPTPAATAAAPEELERRLRETEGRFLLVDGPLDAPERQLLWPELARLNAGLRHGSEAALAWANALWEGEPRPELAQEWAVGERVAPDELDRRLGIERPAPSDVRAVAVACVAFADRPELTTRLPVLLRYLERHERALPVRIAWLAWHALTHRNDPLALARGRDRALDRLLSEGLSHERDLPDFLRYAGQTGGGQLRAVRDRFEALRLRIRAWIGPELKVEMGRPLDRTSEYVDLLFAFGQARLGDAIAARRLLRSAADAIEASGSEGHGILLQAFQYRIEQVIAGRPHTGSLPAEQLEYLEHLRAEEANVPVGDVVRRGGSYAVDRLREQSRVLEPQERFNPYRQIDKTHGSSEVVKELSRLPDLANPAEIATRLRRLLQQVGPSKSAISLRLKVLRDALPLAARVNEALVAEVIAPVAPLLDTIEPTLDVIVLGEQALLTEQAIFFAAHYGWNDVVLKLVSSLEKLFAVSGQLPPAQRGSVWRTLMEVGGPVVGQALRSLRKLGLGDATAELLESVEGLALQGQGFAEAKARAGVDWPESVRLQLSLAAGWLYLGQPARAMPVIEEARALILAKPPLGLRPQTYVPLVCAYIGATSQLPPADALPRITELFEPTLMDHLPNTFTSAHYYSRYHLNIAEAVVLAVASEEFALGPAARRWLEDDEYLVRRRIHRDVRAAIS
ncbi:MAG: hypothetical protein U0746_17340 [Gemmataceae bacterium]